MQTKKPWQVADAEFDAPFDPMRGTGKVPDQGRTMTEEDVAAMLSGGVDHQGTQFALYAMLDAARDGLCEG